MKRIKNSDIQFKLNPKLIYLQDFTIKFYTVNSGTFFVRKNQDDVVEVERDATIYDEDVIASGGTKAIDYYIKLDWHELQNIGEGVLSWRAINNVYDTGFFDTWYNRMVEQSTEYYIDSDIHIDPQEEKNIAEQLTELDERITVEVGDRTFADEYISGVVDSYIASNDAALSATNEALDAEILRATTRETELTDLLNNLRQDLTDESEIRSSADTSIWNAINGEINRATSAETQIASDLSTESQRAIAREDAISGKLDTYISSNDAALLAERTRATNAETLLNTKIETETTRATGVEQILSAAIASNFSTLSTAIQNEETRSEAQETALNAKIDAESLRAETRETAISGALDSYKVTNDTALQAEVTRASSAETAINNKVDNYISANDIKVNTISGRVENYITSNDAALAVEIARATAKEDAISGLVNSYITSNDAALQAEITRANSAETKIATDLSNYISSNNHALSDEVSRATTKENQIETKLDNYIASNNSGVTALETALNAEILRATAKENELSGYVDTRVEELIDGAPQALDTLKEIADKLKDQDDAVAAIISSITEEASARTIADTALGTRIDNLTTATTAADAAEENRAKAAEAQITNALNNEVIRATSAETQLVTEVSELDTRLDNYIISNNAALANENARAISAETALSGRIDLLTGITAVIHEETVRASRAEDFLSGAIDSVSAITSGNVESLTQAIQNEASARTDADNVLSGAIDSVSSALTELDNSLEVRTDYDNGEPRYFLVRKGNARTAIWNFKINGQRILDNKTKIENYNLVSASTFDSYSASTDGKIEYLSGAVSSNTSSINAERQRAISAETELSGYVDTRIEQLIDGAPQALDTLKEIADKLKDQDDAVAAIISAITEETSARTQADNALSGAIDTKLAINDFNTYSAATDNKIEYLSGSVSSNTTAINAERDRAISAETEIISTIDENELATSEAINDLNSRVINIVDNTYSKTEVDDLVNSGATVTALIQRIVELENYIDTLKENNVDKLTLEYNEQTGDYYIGGGDYA